MIWDATYGQQQSMDDLFTGKTVDVCTVRSPSVASASLGTLYWTLVAANAARSATRVNIYDFPDKGHSPEQLPVEELAGILALPSNIHIHRAESVDREFAWNQLQTLQYHTGEQFTPQVAKALPHVQSRPKELERMAEEFAVFLQGHDDPKRIQLSAHEHQTVAMIRALSIPIAKHYARLETGIDGSEFRRDRIPQLSNFSDRLIRGQAQGPHYHQFYQHVLGMLGSWIKNAITVAADEEHLKELWLKNAKENGEYYFVGVPFGSRFWDNLEHISLSNFKADMDYQRDETQLADIERMTKAIDPNLPIHIIHKQGMHLPYHSIEGMQLHDNLAAQVDKALTIAKPHEIDIPYTLDLLCMHRQSIPKQTKDKLVHCLLASYPNELPERISAKLEEAGGTNTIKIYTARKNKINQTPEQKAAERQRKERIAQMSAQAEQQFAMYEPMTKLDWNQMQELLNIDIRCLPPEKQLYARSLLKNNDHLTSDEREQLYDDAFDKLSIRLWKINF